MLNDSGGNFKKTRRGERKSVEMTQADFLLNVSKNDSDCQSIQTNPVVLNYACILVCEPKNKQPTPPTPTHLISMNGTK